MSPGGEKDGFQVNFKVVYPLNEDSKLQTVTNVTIGSVSLSRTISWDELDRKTKDLLLVRGSCCISQCSYCVTY